MWYVQPLADAVYTEIVGGEWSNETHLGTAYAAILVRLGFVPPAKVPALPKVGEDVVAITVVPGRA